MILLLLSMVAAVADEPLSAEDEERAKQLFVHGQQLYDEAKFDEAAAAFQLAYSLSKKPLLLYNMASALERLGRWEEALDAMERYQPDAPPEEADTIERRVASLQGRVDAEREKQAALEAAQNPPPVEPPPKKGPSAGAIVLFGVGAVGLGSGAAFTARTLSARGNWTALCAEGDARLCTEDAQPFVQRDRVSSIVADVSWVVGLGALGGGVAVSLGGGSKATDLVVGPGTLGLEGSW